MIPIVQFTNCENYFCKQKELCGILRNFALYYNMKSLTGGNAMKTIGNPPIKTLTVATFAIFMVASLARADFVVDTIPAGTNPYAVTVNPVTNRTYIANYGSGTVTVINGTTSDTARTITVGSNPRAIALNALTNKIYVANFMGVCRQRIWTKGFQG